MAPRSRPCGLRDFRGAEAQGWSRPGLGPTWAMRQRKEELLIRRNRSQPGTNAVSRDEACFVDWFLSIWDPRSSTDLEWNTRASGSQSQGLLYACATSFAFTWGSEGRRPGNAHTPKICVRIDEKLESWPTQTSTTSDRICPLEIVQVYTGHLGQDENTVPLSQCPRWALRTRAKEPHHRSPPHAGVESGSGSRTQQDQLPSTHEAVGLRLHRAPTFPCEEGAPNLSWALEGRKAGVGRRAEPLPLDDGTAIALARSFFKSVAHACSGPAMVLHFAKQESKGSRDRAN